MNQTDKELLKEVSDSFTEEAEVYNIRKNGESIERKVNSYIDIITKK